MEKYITRDDYLKAKGVDLSLELQDDDDNSNKVNRFIKQITDWCIEYLVFTYSSVELMKWEKLIEVRQDYFRQGVIEQIDYVLRNGLLDKDSGYNAETGMKTNLKDLTLDSTAQRKFWLGGFANVKTGGRGWY